MTANPSPRSFRDTLATMCNTCGDIVLVTEWTQLSLDDTHEVWFRETECLCGVTNTDIEMRETVATDG